MSLIKKYVSIDVQTPKGTRKLKFFKFTGEGENDARPCEDVCPYAKICDTLPDPREPENKERGFMDFCGELSEQEDEKFLDLVPAENTVEENLSDVIGDLYQRIIQDEKLVKVDHVIDEICPGWCGNYVADHSACKVTNKSCLLSGLFMKTKSSSDDTPIKE
jgi:hypothetical protein